MPFPYNNKMENRDEIIKHLNQFLANTAVVYYKTHTFHWNVEGPDFYSLHLFFEKFYTFLWEFLDDLAERIRFLGEQTPPSLIALLKNATIEEGEVTPAAHIMVRQLLQDYIKLEQDAYAVCEVANSLNDFATLDMITKFLGTLEKAIWMLRSTSRSYSD